LEDKRGGSKVAGPNPGGLFAELNKGGAVTQGLRKVTKQKAASSTVTMKKKATKVTKKMGTPKLALDGRKWNCEYYVDDRTGNLVISECTVKESITIFRCINSVIQIKGKINAILLDDCVKTSIVCSTVVSSIDVVNCKSVEVQATVSFGHCLAMFGSPFRLSLLSDLPDSLPTFLHREPDMALTLR
jgi:adenylyl cyclase-associated protein